MIKPGAASLALTLLFAGCGKTEAVKDIEAIADGVCACKDVACAAQEMKKAADLITKYKDTRVSKSEQEQFDAAGEKLAGCMRKLGKQNPP
jgi:hypothetical protein